MTKEQIAEAMAAFTEKGGKIKEVKEGDRAIDPAIRYCKCGCEGNWTDHPMRQGEGRFADQY